MGQLGLVEVLGGVLDALVMGYGAPTDSPWAGALDSLVRVLRSVTSEP
ncbi:hypothetical protein ACFYYY_05595 [Streptomyces sp. NPDC001834]